MTIRVATLSYVVAFLLPSLAFAHCDTLNGPVVAGPARSEVGETCR